MKLSTITKGEATFTFSSDDYVLVYQPDVRYDERTDEKVWSLNYLIDRSYKGKGPDIGEPLLYLTDEQAEELRKAGFLKCELP